MKTIQEIRAAKLPGWLKATASILPLWLLSLAITAEGFPRPPIPIELAETLSVLFLPVSFALLWAGWGTIELIVYSLFPILLLFTFDEITTNYKTPFILLCALILTAGVFSYQRIQLSRPLRLLILLAVATVTMFLAWHAAFQFWNMADALGYVRCFPDYQGCEPLSGQETAPWILFFTP